MKPEPDKLSRVGTFTVTPGGKVLGTLLLDGQNSRVYLRDEKRFTLKLSENTKITGVLDDQTTVSIIGSWHPTIPSSAMGPGGLVYSYDLFPEYVVIGNQDLSGKEEKVGSIQFVPEDWEALFGGARPFGVVWNDEAITKKLVKLDHPDREPDLGKRQAIFYWTGKSEVFSCITPTGTVSAFHSVRTGWPTAQGFRFDREVCVEIKFDRLVSFYSAIQVMLKTLMCFDYLVGRVQNNSGLAITLNGKALGLCKIHSCVAPRHDRPPDHLSSDPGRSLIDVTKDPERFGRILSSWLSRDSGWSEARWNLLNGWRNPHVYGSDRIVRAANLFDLIPSGSFPKNPQPPDEVETALSNTKTEIEKLPEGIDKDRIKTSIGMVGKYGLKQRILHRAKMVTDEFGDEIPEISLVCREAGDCRNRHVHGTPSRINYEEHLELFVFLVNTLEFVFVISDLIEAGWRRSDWNGLSAPRSHPFRVYLNWYRADLENLKKVLGK